MKTKNKIQTIHKKARRFKQKATKLILSPTPLRMFAKNRTAVSAVVSNIILIAAVIVVGMATLAWTQSQSADYQKTQTGVVNQDISQLQERISFEYISYSSPTLTVYVLNSGTINNVNVTSIQISSNISNSSTPISVNNLYLLNGASVKSLNIGQDGYFKVSVPNGVIIPGTNATNTIKVITSRGSSFVTNFAP